MPPCRNAPWLACFLGVTPRPLHVRYGVCCLARFWTRSGRLRISIFCRRRSRAKRTRLGRVWFSTMRTRSHFELTDAARAFPGGPLSSCSPATTQPIDADHALTGIGLPVVAAAGLLGPIHRQLLDLCCESWLSRHVLLTSMLVLIVGRRVAGSRASAPFRALDAPLRRFFQSPRLADTEPVAARPCRVDARAVSASKRRWT